MAEVVGVVAAALQFAAVTLKVIHLARALRFAANSEAANRKITQLETFVEVAEKIGASWTQDDPLTEKILKQCTSTVTELARRLERVIVAETDGSRKKTKKALLAWAEKDDIEELFQQLSRDQVALLLHRSFSSDNELIEKFGQLLDARLQQPDPQDPDELRFLNGIFITDPRDDRSALVARKGHRVEGTCTWVTETDIYRSWLSTAPGPTGLMIQGSPGKGKTMMAIYLTEQLELLLDSGSAVIYFFCDNRNPKQNNALAVVRCLLWQLCRLRPALLCHGAKELRERGDNIDNLLKFETLWRIFEVMRQDENAGAVTCVVDGLDECDDNSIFAILEKLAGSERNPHFKFLILCRPPTPRQQVPGASTNITKLLLDADKDGNIQRDVVEFVRQRVREVANASPERQWSEKLRMHVEDTLQKKAGGTFLWVGFITQDLRRRSSTEVRKYLKSLPADLNEIYDRILKELPSEYRAKIRSLLRWITLAEHPMQLSELVSLIEIRKISDSHADSENGSDADSEADSYMETEEDILKDLLAFIGHFIIVTGRTVYFVHQSAKDYLLRSTRAADSDLEYFRITDREAGHEELTRQCLDLLHCQLPHVKKEDGWGSEEYEYTSFHYALHFWRHHVEHSGSALRQPDTTEKIVRLFRPDDLLWQWLQCLGKNSSVGPDVGCFPPTGTAYRPNPRMISDLGFSIDSSSSSPFVSCRTPAGTVSRHKLGVGTDLGFAISLRLEAIFDQILEVLSVDEYLSAVTTGPPVFNWPLHISLVSKQPRYFQRLLDKYGNIAVSHEKSILSYAVLHAEDHYPANSIGRKPEYQYLSALLAVTENLRALYESDLDKALTQAVKRLKVDITHLLVEKGADPNVIDEKGDSALHRLANSRRIHHPLATPRLEVARCLISRDCNRANPDAAGENNNTPLHVAASRQNSAFVQLLLDCGARSDVVNLEGRTPLHMAAAIGAWRHENRQKLAVSARKTAELLIRDFPLVPFSTANKPSRVDEQDRHGQTALHLAAFHGNESMVQLLLDHKARTDCKDAQGRTALHMAAAGGHFSNVRRLVNSGADVNYADVRGRTPLALVVETIRDTDILESRSFCIKHLVAGGATHSGQDAEGRTLLHILAQKLQQRAQAIMARGATSLSKGSRRVQFATPPPDHSKSQESEPEPGAVHVLVPHRHTSDLRPPLERHVLVPEVFPPRTETLRNFRMVGNKMRNYLTDLSIDEAMKDNHGLTAREYYPDDDFWDYKGDYHWLRASNSTEGRNEAL